MSLHTLLTWRQVRAAEAMTHTVPYRVGNFFAPVTHFSLAGVLVGLPPCKGRTALGWQYQCHGVYYCRQGVRVHTTGPEQRGKKENCYVRRAQNKNHTMAMAGDPRDRRSAAGDDPGVRARLAPRAWPRACLRPVQYCRPPGAILGPLLLGAISLPTSCCHIPSAGLCPTRPPDP
jgi:hypothetical protein